MNAPHHFPHREPSLTSDANHSRREHLPVALLGTDDDHRHVPRPFLLAELAKYGVAVDTGHGKVEQKKVRLSLPQEHGERFFPAYPASQT